jgi:hypothetical protein
VGAAPILCTAPTHHPVQIEQKIPQSTEKPSATPHPSTHSACEPNTLLKQVRNNLSATLKCATSPLLQHCATRWTMRRKTQTNYTKTQNPSL